MKTQRILFIRSRAAACDQLQLILEYIGTPLEAVNGEAFFSSNFADDDFNLIIIHKQLTDDLYPRALSAVSQAYPQLPIIIFEGSDEDLAHAQVSDILTLPISQLSLLQALHRCQRQKDQHTQIREADDLVGESSAMCQLRELIFRVASKNVNVLITGESGTGKELAARSIHKMSDRRGGPFVPINCCAIPDELLESELFGHEKGSFTGAITARKGRFELAHGGTLFLDEIGDMPLAMQVKLLRVLQERRFERVGGAKSIEVDVRVVAATHCDLVKAVEASKFREDLYYRLNVFPLKMPPLRDRPDDLPLLQHELTQRFSDLHYCTINFTDAAMARLQQYHWPGNVRELANLIERLMVMAPNGVIDVEDLPAQFQSPEDPQQAVSNFSHALPEVKYGLDLKQYMEQTEMTLIKKALDQSGGVVAHAARLLNVRRTTLVEKMRKHNLKRSEESQPADMA